MNDNIFNKILDLFTPILNFIKSPNGKYFIFAYLIIICISMYFLSSYRNKQIISQNTEHILKNTNREKAIESFNNYNKQIAEKIDKECSNILANTAKYNTDKKSVLPNKQGIFYFNNLERLIETYISNNILTDIKEKRDIIDNYYLSLDLLIDNMVKREFDNINNIITEIMKLSPELISELKYSNQQKVQSQIDNINTTVIDEFVNDIQTELRRIMSFDETRNAIVINETPIPEFIKKEIHERMYVKIYTFILENKVFADYCKLKTQINSTSAELESAYRKSYDTNSDKDSVVSELSKLLNELKRKYAITQQKYTLYLLCLNAFSTALKTKQLMQEELKKMSIGTIQPANDNVIDNMMSSKSRLYNKLSSTPKLLTTDEQIIDQNERIAESTIANKYSTLANNYETDLQKMNGDTRIDPISIFSNVEQSAISFLEGIRGGNTTTNQDEIFKTRFDNDTAVRGTFLANDDMDLNSNKSNYKTVAFNNYNNSESYNGYGDGNRKENATTIEGFENGVDGGNAGVDGSVNDGGNDGENSDLLQNVSSQFLSLSKGIMDNDMIQTILQSFMRILNLDNIKSSEQLGVLLIVISVLLYFIDLSS